jgi:hypothetical protein
MHPDLDILRFDEFEVEFDVDVVAEGEFVGAEGEEAEVDAAEGGGGGDAGEG